MEIVSDHRCFFCFARAFEKLLQAEHISNENKNNFTKEAITLFKTKWDILNSPELARELHNLLKKYTHNPDPYKKAKKESNDQAMVMVPELTKLIALAYDPFDTALRLSIAGNIIDFGANDNFNLKETIEKVLNSEFAIDHSTMLKRAIKGADTVLYLGDNAGEIVFDKLFIETISHPNLIYVVRGEPVINDATMEDAEYIGMNNSVKVISSGYDAPSTVVNKSGKMFQQYFKDANVIISKGQGNLEGLMPLNDDRIFFLLMIKCDVIAELLKVNKESFVVFNRSFFK